MTTTSLFRVAALVALLSVVGSIEAQSSGGNFRIRSHVIADGGGRSTGGSFALSGTAGQADAGNQVGGSFRLQGGFWPSSLDDTIFRNGFEQ